MSTNSTNCILMLTNQEKQNIGLIRVAFTAIGAPWKPPWAKYTFKTRSDMSWDAYSDVYRFDKKQSGQPEEIAFILAQKF